MGDKELFNVTFKYLTKRELYLNDEHQLKFYKLMLQFMDKSDFKSVLKAYADEVKGGYGMDSVLLKLIGCVATQKKLHEQIPGQILNIQAFYFDKTCSSKEKIRIYSTMKLLKVEMYYLSQYSVDAQLSKMVKPNKTIVVNR